ncbi:hypothetical protein [Methanoregula sp.]|uniref:hypothetical protein n=1 Tax=Methanoregula sp. TaxID=2052170 RepID=UPI003C724FAA
MVPQPVSAPLSGLRTGYHGPRDRIIAAELSAGTVPGVSHCGDRWTGAGGNPVDISPAPMTGSPVTFTRPDPGY